MDLTESLCHKCSYWLWTSRKICRCSKNIWIGKTIPEWLSSSYRKAMQLYLKQACMWNIIIILHVLSHIVPTALKAGGQLIVPLHHRFIYYILKLPDLINRKVATMMFKARQHRMPQNLQKVFQFVNINIYNNWQSDLFQTNIFNSIQFSLFSVPDTIIITVW